MPKHLRQLAVKMAPKPKERTILVNWRSPNTLARVQVSYEQKHAQKYVDGRQLVAAVCENEQKDKNDMKIFFDEAGEPLDGASRTAIKITIVKAMLNDEDDDVWIELGVYNAAPEPKKDKKKKKKKESSSSGKQHSPATKRIYSAVL